MKTIHIYINLGFYHWFIMVYPCLSNLGHFATEVLDITSSSPKSLVLILCCYSASVAQHDGFKMISTCCTATALWENVTSDKSKRNVRKATLQDWSNLSGQENNKSRPSNHSIALQNCYLGLASSQSSQIILKYWLWFLIHFSLEILLVTFAGIPGLELLQLHSLHTVLPSCWEGWQQVHREPQSKCSITVLA